VVRTQFKYHEVQITTETKTKGRRTGESPAVNSVPRMDWVRSDLPPLFNQNHFIMRTQNDDCATCAKKPLTAESIIKELISCASMEYFKKGLHDLFISWVSHEELTEGEYKDTVIYTYTCLDELIESVDKLKKQKEL